VFKNADFGLSFQFPAEWYGPDEYSWGQGLRIEVGSDVVYPYGTGLDERIYEVEDSYYVIIQYNPNVNHLTLEEYRQQQPWINTYLELLDMADGESQSGPRDLTIRVRPVTLGDFEGVEYISTLSETAQTEIVYSRQVVLLDEDLNLLTVSGSPNNVVLTEGGNWREDYQRVDQENLAIFQQILESIVIDP
jgi:hypothetical protein